MKKEMLDECSLLILPHKNMTNENEIIFCPYCHARAELVDSKYIYGTDYGNKIWVCKNFPVCDAYVGAHKKSDKPFGSLANAELRELRMECHNKFDKLWKTRIWPDRVKRQDYEDQRQARSDCYRWLRKIMEIEEEDKTHIGMFDIAQCQRLLKVLDEL